MRKTCLLVTLLFTVNIAFASKTIEIPNDFFVTQQWVGQSSSFGVETKEKKVGALYRKWLGLILTYEFYDPEGDFVATAKARFFSIGAHFDVLDTQRQPIGMVEELVYTILPTFEISSTDGVKLAKAEMNAWSTEFTIRDTQTNEIIALMTRPFIRSRNDWSIHIIDKNLLEARNIDPRLFLTVIAFQGDIEEWSKNRSNIELTPADRRLVKLSLETLSVAAHLEQTTLPDVKRIENIAKQVDLAYKTDILTHASSHTHKDHALDFIQFCTSWIESNQTEPADKKALIDLLRQRFDITHA